MLSSKKNVQIGIEQLEFIDGRKALNDPQFCGCTYEVADWKAHNIKGTEEAPREF
jgi:hypothetical protein